MIPGALKCVGRWTPCRTLLERRFVPSSTDDIKKLNDCGCPSPVKATTEEPESGEIPTPTLRKATSTEDFMLSVQKERLRQKSAKEKDKEVDVLKLHETFKKGKTSADLDSG